MGVGSVLKLLQICVHFFKIEGFVVQGPGASRFSAG